MNLLAISKGQKFKNYKELCNKLDIPIRSGEAKIKQLKELEKYIKFTKNKHEIIIEDIFENKEIILNTDNRKMGGRSKYVDDLSIQLLGYLVEKKKLSSTQDIFLTANEIFLATGMMNEDYLPTKKAIKQFVEQLISQQETETLEIKDVYEFFSRTENKMRDILSSTIKNLTNRFIIRVYAPKHMIKIGFEWKLATEEQENMIMDIKNIVTYQMNYKTITEIHLSRKSREFYAKVNDALYEKYGWQGCYSGFLIKIGNELEPSYIRYKKEIENSEYHKFKLNDKVSRFFNDEAEKIYNKNKQKYDAFIEEAMKQINWQSKEVWGEDSPIEPDIQKIDKYKDTYISDQSLLTDKLIKLKKGEGQDLSD